MSLNLMPAGLVKQTTICCRDRPMASNRHLEGNRETPSAVGRSVLARLGMLVVLLLIFAALVVLLVQTLEAGR